MDSNFDQTISVLKKPRFSKKNINISYRALNHYESLGIIENNRTDNSSWRKFDSIEFIWINIIITLRDFGFSLKKIQTFKHNMFSDGKLGTIDKASFINRSFEEEIVFSILEKHKLYLIIFDDLSYSFQDDKMLNQWSIKSYKDSFHINIPLNKYIKEIVTSFNT